MSRTRDRSVAVGGAWRILGVVTMSGILRRLLAEPDAAAEVA